MTKAKAKAKPDLSPFEIAKRHAEADLMAVAMLFVSAAEAVAAGDIDRVTTVVEKMPLWQQSLAIRHATRMDELRDQDDTALTAGK